MEFKEYTELVNILTYKICDILQGQNRDVVLNAVSNALGNCIFEVSKTSNHKTETTIDGIREDLINVTIKTVRDVLEARDAQERKRDATNG